METDKEEEKIYEWWAGLRTKALRPLTKLLAKLGVKPDMVTYLGVLVMCVFIYEVNHSKVIAFWIIVLVLFIDSLDGSLARYLKTESDRGKFTDTLVDTTNFMLFIVGLASVGLIEGWTAALYVYFMAVVKVLMVINRSLHRESDWLILPRAGAYPHNFAYASYFLFGVYAFSSHDYLQVSSAIFAGLLIVKAIWDYWTVRTTVFKKYN